jgi:hypothetical protein
MHFSLGLAQTLVKKNAPNLLFGARHRRGWSPAPSLACRGDAQDGGDPRQARPHGPHRRRRTCDRPDDYTDGEARKTSSPTSTAARSLEVTQASTSRPIIVGGLSVAALTKSHNILNDRVTNLTAAYAALDAGVRRVPSSASVDKYGDDVDHQLRFPRDKVRETNPATGREHTVEVIKADLGRSAATPSFFDARVRARGSTEPEYNLVLPEVPAGVSPTGHPRARRVTCS